MEATPRGSAASTNMTTEAREPFKLLSGGALNVNPITETNIQQSPLLNLPPEIRNRIYSYVLGGNTLHCVSNRNSKVKSRFKLTFNVCLLPEYDHSASPRCRRQGYPCNVEYNMYHRSSGCNVDVNPRSSDARHTLCLNLLRVCQSIYNECALLPFAINTFDFLYEPHLISASESFLPYQLHAVRKLNAHGLAPWNQFAGGLIRFKALNELSILSRGYDDSNEWDWGDLDGPSFWAEEMLPKEDVADLKSLPLSKINIRFTLPETAYDEEVADVAAWTEELEKWLLEDTTAESKVQKD